MDIEEIKRKREVLNNVGIKLKKHFIGIDDIIDKLIKNVEVWYVMPELLDRPIIVNLWGTTGVGKTDLVRRFVSELKYNEKYVEVQLDTGTDTGWGGNYTIKNQIDTIGIKEHDSAIVLLDEIQRFRSIDEQGNTINNSKYQDIWMMLSDGKFNNRDTKKINLNWLLFELLYDKDSENSGTPENLLDEDSNGRTVAGVTYDNKGAKIKFKEDEEKKERKYKTNVWSSSSFKSTLELDDSIEEIMRWDIDKKINMIESEIKKLAVRTDDVDDKMYKKILIFISGNIDEAFTMSDDVSEVSTDADVYHEFTKRISIITIKDALKTKFKPEQISRFGNIHLIYPTLSKKSYNKLITRNLNNIIKKTKKSHGVEIKFSPEIKNIIYENGVFPIQGVRPLFSTITSIINNSLPYFIMECKILGGTKLNVTNNKFILYSDILKSNKVIGKLERKVDLDITKLKEDIDKDLIVTVCVHEAAHAVIYGLESNITPLQIVGNSVSDTSSGFVISHNHSGSKKEFISRIRVALAGIVGEELIFDETMKRSGASNDLERATLLASRMYRSYNMFENVSKVGNAANSLHEAVINYDIDDSNKEIEKFLKEQKEIVREKLMKYTDFFVELIDTLIFEKQLSAKQYYDIAVKYIPEIELKEVAIQSVLDYRGKYEMFKDTVEFAKTPLKISI